MHTQGTYPVGFVVAEFPVDRPAEFIHLVTLMSTSSPKLHHDHSRIPTIFQISLLSPL